MSNVPLDHVQQNPFLRRSVVKNNIRVSTLVFLAFSTLFFARLTVVIGAPSLVNFLHFITVPAAFGFSLIHFSPYDKNHSNIVKLGIFGLFLLLLVTTISAFINDAGVINIGANFMLLSEPFIFLIAFICMPMNLEKIQFWRTWIVRLSFFHIGWSAVQFVLFLIMGVPPPVGGWPADNPDNIQGIFFHSYGGHVIGGSVSLTFGIYYFIFFKQVPLWFRSFVMLATIWLCNVADAKQSLLGLLVAACLLVVTKSKQGAQAIKYLAGLSIVLTILDWARRNVPAFSAFNTWLRPEIYVPGGEARVLKGATFRVVSAYQESVFNLLFGLGPGHTVGRLGGWMMDSYWHLLGPLGATVHPASRAVWAEISASWLGDQSSMFSPMFTWAGIWGDLGLMGLFAYFFLAYIVWRYLCVDDFSKFLLLCVFVFGFILSQVEEPGYMLYVAVLIGLQWHEQQVNARSSALLF